MTSEDIRGIYLVRRVFETKAVGESAGRPAVRPRASTGTGLWAAQQLSYEMASAGRQGSVVSLLCDGGDRYRDKYYSSGWLREQEIDPAPHASRLAALLRTPTATADHA